MRGGWPDPAETSRNELLHSHTLVASKDPIKLNYNYPKTAQQ